MLYSVLLGVVLFTSTGLYDPLTPTKEANIKLGLTGVLHVLKGRAKQCGGWFFEYKN